MFRGRCAKGRPSGYGVLDIGYRVSGIGYRVLDIGYRISGIGRHYMPIGYRVWDRFFIDFLPRLTPFHSKRGRVARSSQSRPKGHAYRY